MSGSSVSQSIRANQSGSRPRSQPHRSATALWSLHGGRGAYRGRSFLDSSVSFTPLSASPTQEETHQTPSAHCGRIAVNIMFLLLYRARWLGLLDSREEPAEDTGISQRHCHRLGGEEGAKRRRFAAARKVEAGVLGQQTRLQPWVTHPRVNTFRSDVLPLAPSPLSVSVSCCLDLAAESGRRDRGARTQAPACGE